jgi:hypothetical protein
VARPLAGISAFQKALIVIVAICLTSLAGTALFIYTQKDFHQSMYRDDNLETYLGELPRPVKIFRNDKNAFIGITRKNERLPLEKIPPIKTTDESTNIFFDKYDDRLFYQKDHKLYMYDIQAQSTRTLPYRGGSVKDYEVAGVYKNRLLLRKNQGVSAATAQFTPYDLDENRISPRDYDSTILSSEHTVLVAFTMGEERQRLYLTMKPAVANRSDTLSIYLKGYDSDKYPDLKTVSSPLPAGDDVFARGRSAGPDLERRPLIRVSTRALTIFGDVLSGTPFRIREVYALPGQRVAVAIDDRLAVIDVKQNTAVSIEDEGRIRQLLQKAELLAAPIENQFSYYTESHCFPDQYPGPTIENAEFAFCLE